MQSGWRRLLSQRRLLCFVCRPTQPCDSPVCTAMLVRRWVFLGAGGKDAPAKYCLVRANPQEQRFHRIVLSPDMVLTLLPAAMRAWTCPLLCTLSR